MGKFNIAEVVRNYYKKNKGMIYTFIAFCIFYIILLYIFRYFDISQERITSWINQFGSYSLLALLFIQFIGSITPIPDSLITAIGMVLYGPFLGGAIIFLGMYMAGCVHFLIARKLGKDFITKKFPDVGRLANKFDKSNAVIKLTYLRMFTFVSFDIASYVAGVSNVSFWKYTLAFIFGLIPHIVSYGFITQGLISDGSILSVIPGVTIFLIMFLVANWPKKNKSNNI